ncbi:MAG: peptidase U32 family protein [Clostridium sp.]|nr:U32 family peptidase [Clostridium sp.]
MKIVAGLGSIDDYIALAKAGADEVFCGYVPYEWNKKYGTLFPLNRREVLYYNVNIGSLEDMKILKKMEEKYKVKVNITFNYLYYLEEQYEIIAKLISELIDIGFTDFIIADIALILYLEEKNIKCNIHLSGECAEINSLSIDFFNQFSNINRYIFHRKNSILDMKSCILNNKRKMEYEAFILNEKCHYTGAFCSSFHCDELAHLCKVSYKLGKINEEVKDFNEVDKKIKLYYSEDIEEYKDYDLLGSTGCGLCSLKKLKEAGVTHLKVVGRGNSIDFMERDVKELRTALDILEKISNGNYEEEMKNKLFKNKKCSRNCYY